MGNSITVIQNPDNSKFVPQTSRYMKSTLIYYQEEKNQFLTFETYKRTTYVPSATDRYTVINNGTQYRPDLVSMQAYGTPDFWWKIMEVNKIYDIYNFVSGTNILIPSDVY